MCDSAGLHSFEWDTIQSLSHSLPTNRAKIATLIPPFQNSRFDFTDVRNKPPPKKCQEIPATHRAAGALPVCLRVRCGRRRFFFFFLNEQECVHKGWALRSTWEHYMMFLYRWFLEPAGSLIISAQASAADQRSHHHACTCGDTHTHSLARTYTRAQAHRHAAGPSVCHSAPAVSWKLLPCRSALKFRGLIVLRGDVSCLPWCSDSSFVLLTFFFLFYFFLQFLKIHTVLIVFLWFMLS